MDCEKVSKVLSDGSVVYNVIRRCDDGMCVSMACISETHADALIAQLEQLVASEVL